MSKTNGKSKKKSKYSVKNKYKRTNKKRYILYYQKNGTVRDEYGDEVLQYTDYLKTPGGVIKLCTYTTEDEL